MKTYARYKKDVHRERFWHMVKETLACTVIFISTLALMLFMSLCAKGAEPDSVVARASWQPADTTGGHVPAVLYMVHVECDSLLVIIDVVPDTTTTLLLESGKTYRLQVAGIGAAGGMGLYSGWSEPYTVPHPAQECECHAAEIDSALTAYKDHLFAWYFTGEPANIYILTQWTTTMYYILNLLDGE